MTTKYKVIDVLTVFMFHKVTEPPMLQEFESFLIYLKKKYNIVMPGDNVSLLKKSACLTFDDAYFDFYEFVFPLLKKHNIPAILAVPTDFILDETSESRECRLVAPTLNHLKAPYCTWRELKQIACSGIVEIASHHHTHASAKSPDFSFEQEIVLSKKIIENKLNVKVQTLIYPYGDFKDSVHSRALKYYQYTMRIGGALNFSWGGASKLIYRVDADNFWMKNKRVNVLNKLMWMCKLFSNKVRGK